MRLLSLLLAWFVIGLAVPATAASPAAPLKIARPEAAKGVTEVVIGAFNVGFLFESIDRTKASGGMIKPSALPGLVASPGGFGVSGLGGIGVNMDVKWPGAFSFSGVKVNSGLSVTADYFKLSLISAGRMATITITRPIAVEGDFATMADTTRDKGLQSAANVAGGLLAAMGGPGIAGGKSRTFTFVARPDAYREGAIKAAALTNAQLAALR